jgi:hypothetical protein
MKNANQNDVVTSTLEDNVNDYYVAGITFEPEIVGPDGYLIDINSDKMIKYIEKSLSYSSTTIKETFSAISEHNKELIYNTICLLGSLPFNPKFVKTSTIDGNTYIDVTMKIYRLRDILISLKLPLYDITSKCSVATHGKYIIITTEVSLYNDYFNVAGVDNTIHIINPNAKEESLSIELTKSTRKSRTLAIENALLNLGIGFYLY